MAQLKLKKIRLTSYDLSAFTLIIIATLLRFILIYFNWPITNSDEGTMGMLALHVAYKGEWPIFLYGQLYMGPIEGYLAAPLFHLLGPSLFSLRLGLLCFYPLFLLCMYYLTIRLYNRKYALFIVLLLSVGSDETIQRQVKAVGEYPETIFFAALISLLVVWIVQTGYSIPPQERTSWQRTWIYGLLGFVIGIAFWVDLLILPIVGTGFLLLLLFCRQELWSRSGISLILGMLIGAFPLIIYNVTAPLNQNSLVVLYNLQHSNGDKYHTFGQQILGTTGISIPDVMNFNPMCIKDVATLLNGQQVACAAAQLSWGTGYLIIYGFALLTTALLAWRGWKSMSLKKQEWTFEQQKLIINDFCRLMLLVSAGGTILAYMTSPHPATVPAPTARYLTCLLIALPAVLWPSWTILKYRRDADGGRRDGACPRPRPYSPSPNASAVHGRTGASPSTPTNSPENAQKPGRSSVGTGLAPVREMVGDVGRADRDGPATHLRTGASPVPTVFGVGLLLLFLMISTIGIYNTFEEIPAAQSFYASQNDLIQHLVDIGATRFYSEYWTCNRLIFQSNEKVICSPLDEKLGPSFDRYIPYRTTVNETKDPAYVFPKNASQIAVMDAKMQSHTLKQSYQRQEFGNYVIYYVPRTTT